MSLVFQTDMIKAIVTEKMTEPVVKRNVLPAIYNVLDVLMSNNLCVLVLINKFEVLILSLA